MFPGDIIEGAFQENSYAVYRQATEGDLSSLNYSMLVEITGFVDQIYKGKESPERTILLSTLYAKKEAGLREIKELIHQGVPYHTIKTKTSDIISSLRAVTENTAKIQSQLDVEHSATIERLRQGSNSFVLDPNLVKKVLPKEKKKEPWEITKLLQSMEGKRSEKTSDKGSFSLEEGPEEADNEM